MPFYWFQSLYQEACVQEPIVNSAITSSKENLKTKEPGKEKDKLSATISEIEKRWNELHKKIVLRHAVIRKICPFAEQFSAETEILLPWLLTADKEIRLIQPLSSQSVMLIQQKRAIEVNCCSCCFLLSVNSLLSCSMFILTVEPRFFSVSQTVKIILIIENS